MYVVLSGAVTVSAAGGERTMARLGRGACDPHQMACIARCFLPVDQQAVVLQAVEPCEEGEAGLVVLCGRLEDDARQSLTWGHQCVIPIAPLAGQEPQRQAGRLGDRVENAE